MKIPAQTRPKMPLNKPTRKLSEVNISLMSDLRAPIDFKTPISFVRSVTLIYITTKIIIAETIIATNEIMVNERPIVEPISDKIPARLSSIEPVKSSLCSFEIKLFIADATSSLVV